MTRRRPFGTVVLAALTVLVLATGACTVVDEPGSAGPDRPTTPPPAAIAGADLDLVELSCASIPEVDVPLHDPHRRALDDALSSPAFDGLDVSVSIWIDGHGEVAATDPDSRLLPASNQKLFTAMGALALLDPAHRFRTEVTHRDGVLTLVAGGDPTLARSGPHSLAALADQVAAAGVGRVEVVAVDADHFESARRAEGWQDWHIPDWVGPMSALIVEDNRYRTDAAFLADPALANLEAFAAALTSAGVDVAGAPLVTTTDETGDVVAVLESAPIAELVPDLLTRSDNETAEAVLREIGAGSTAEGVATVDDALAELCEGLQGVSGDGSGLSRADLRSAREWRSMLQAARDEPWGPALRAGLPVAGRTGTLARRLGGSTTAGNVMAKTGSIIGGQALSGYAVTSGGHDMVFSIVVNGDPSAARSARVAIDALVVAAVG
ncbi:MAG: D-alanyl-D-alanine carboxypeptidase/D-alanyl-D-alanine-endopeptidase [Acidimicrobiales bacterium]